MSEQRKAIELAEKAESHIDLMLKMNGAMGAQSFLPEMVGELRRLDAENAALKDKVAHKNRLIGMIDTHCLEAGVVPLDTYAMVRSLIAERDALRAQLAQGKPVAWVRFRSDGGYEGPLMDSDERISDIRRKEWTPLYTAPQQAPVSDNLIREVFLRNGFTVKEGQSDLKPYVFAAARDLLASAAPQQAPANHTEDKLAMVDELELPRLPWASYAVITNSASTDYYTADQMREYAMQARAALKPVIPSKLAGNANPLNFSNTEARVAYVMGWNGCVDSMRAAAKE